MIWNVLKAKFLCIWTYLTSFNIHNSIWALALHSPLSQWKKLTLRLSDFTKTTQLVRNIGRKPKIFNSKVLTFFHSATMVSQSFILLFIHSTNILCGAYCISIMVISSGQYSSNQIHLSFDFIELLEWCIQTPSVNFSSSPSIVNKDNSLICESRACYT